MRGRTLAMGFLRYTLEEYAFPISSFTLKIGRLEYPLPAGLRFYPSLPPNPREACQNTFLPSSKKTRELTLRSSRRTIQGL